jgi:hypothetical protein
MLRQTPKLCILFVTILLVTTKATKDRGEELYETILLLKGDEQLKKLSFVKFNGTTVIQTPSNTDLKSAIKTTPPKNDKFSLIILLLAVIMSPVKHGIMC